MSFEIVQVPHEPEGARRYVERYKAFRLLALQTSPEAFASTHAREATFSDDIWYGRLTNPEAVTLFALRSENIISTLTILGPLSCNPEQLAPSANPWELEGGNEDLPQLHYRINGMFTIPEARGKGIAKALIARAKDFGANESEKVGKDYVVTMAVEKDNTAARSLYGKCGFVSIKEETFSIHGKTQDVVLMIYDPGWPPRFDA